MRQAYITKRFTAESRALIDVINSVCNDYMAQGFVLTVRQLYYQLVARNIIPNTERSYKNTTSLVNDARLAGYIDWDAIEDRTRAFVERAHWDDGKSFMTSVAPQFYVDMWDNQHERVFVVVEKEALAGVLEGVCREYDVPFLAARGYPSVSVIREFVESKLLYHGGDQRTTVLHLGDHDPSGIDMTRDLRDRMELLVEGEVDFTLERIALNMNQIQEVNAPPNPAKITDSRARTYIQRYGHESWELDALEPAYIVDLVSRNIEAHRDYDLWEEREQMVSDTRSKLRTLAAEFES